MGRVVCKVLQACAYRRVDFRDVCLQSILILTEAVTDENAARRVTTLYAICRLGFEWNSSKQHRTEGQLTALVALDMRTL